MAAVNRPEQPLTSVEFEAGEGDYGSSLDVRLDPSTEDFKIRLSLAQDNRWLNLYLFSGGINRRLDEPVGDGNDRIGFIGERHGFNAPVGPEGQLSTTYPQLAQTIPTMMAVADELAVAREEHDRVTLGFIPDYYLTESVYPKSASMREIADNLTRTRGAGPRAALARAMLALCFRFGCLDLQHRPLDPTTTPVLALASARNMSAAIQTKLIDYLAAGGQLLMVGEVPLADMDGAAVYRARRMHLDSSTLARNTLPRITTYRWLPMVGLLHVLNSASAGRNSSNRRPPMSCCGRTTAIMRLDLT